MFYTLIKACFKPQFCNVQKTYHPNHTVLDIITIPLSKRIKLTVTVKTGRKPKSQRVGIKN